MNSAKTPVKAALKTRLLTAAEFQRLGEVPPEAEWFKNIRNPATKRAYEYIRLNSTLSNLGDVIDRLPQGDNQLRKYRLAKLSTSVKTIDDK